MPTTSMNGFEMHYEVRGDGEPLLLLHGGMGIGDDWCHVFPSDPPGYRVIVPDLRGHGRSTNPGGAFTFRQCAQDVLALLDHLGVERVKAIGLSMGAKTLLHVGAAQFTPEAFDRLSDGERHTLGQRHVHGDDQVRALYAMTRSFATSDHDMAFTGEQLRRITARTLIVHGDRDPYYPVEMAVELFHGIPQAALWIVPDGAHGPVFGPLAPTFVRQAMAHLESSKSALKN